MAYELKDGQGSLFRNDKEGNDSRPDYRGRVNIGGTVYQLAGWIRDGKQGKWVSLSAQEDRSAPQKAKGRSESVDDEIPF